MKCMFNKKRLIDMGICLPMLPPPSDKLTAFYFAAPVAVNPRGKKCSQVTLESRELVLFSDAIRAH